jgi:hypothetical protein
LAYQYYILLLWKVKRVQARGAKLLHRYHIGRPDPLQDDTTVRRSWQGAGLAGQLRLGGMSSGGGVVLYFRDILNVERAPWNQKRFKQSRSPRL